MSVANPHTIADVCRVVDHTSGLLLVQGDKGYMGGRVPEVVGSPDLSIRWQC